MHGTNFMSIFTKTAGNVATKRVNFIYSEETVTKLETLAGWKCHKIPPRKKPAGHKVLT